jgi:sterol 14-demethylase
MAKLQVTIVTAFWLAMFQYELVDKFGKSTHHLPAINLNLYGAEKPKEKIYLKYKLNNQ